MSNIVKKDFFSPVIEKMMDIGLTEVEIKKEISFAVQLCARNKKLAQCTPESLLTSVVNLSLVGLTLNPISKLAFLIPRYNSITKLNEAVLEPSYVGLVKVLTDAGAIKQMIAQLVYEKDNVSINLADNQHPIVHKPELVKSKRGDVIGVYAIGVLSDGSKQLEYIDIEEIHTIRDRSEAYKYYLKKDKAVGCIWVSDEGEMCRKTVIKRLTKYLPKSTRVDKLINIMDQDYMPSLSKLGYAESLLETTAFDHDIREDISMEMTAANNSQLDAIIKRLNNNQLPAQSLSTMGDFPENIERQIKE